MKTLHKPLTSYELIKKFLKGSVWLFVLKITFDMLKTFAEMVVPQIMRIAIDNVIGGKEAELSGLTEYIVEKVGGISYLAEHLILMALAIMAVSLFQVGAEYCSRVFGVKASETLIKSIRDHLFKHIERLPFSWHMKNHTGDIIQRCTSDVEMVKRFVSMQLTNMLCIVFYVIMAVVFMLPMSPKLTLIALIPMPFIVIYSVSFHKRISKGFRNCDENEGKLSGMAQENLTGVRVVRAFGREASEREKFEKHNAFYTSLWIKLSKTMSFFHSTSDILSAIQVMLVIVFGAIFCVKGEMSAGTYVAFISYNTKLQWPFRMLGRMISELSKAVVSIERIKYIMNSEPEQDPEDAVKPEIKGEISFESVNFAYENCPQLLHDINFKMEAGTTLGILGSTGSGKSTLMLLLDKLYDLPEGCGTIKIDGVDIRQIDTAHLRQNIGMVLQEPFLFSRTIAENIGITSNEITLTEIRDAARAACLDETINEFANGYDTFVGERGVTLSGGQKQRAAIARMLTRTTPIMIFDDSLSAVDAQTDANIRAELEKRFGTSSIILISHRISTLAKADKILVLDEGRIIEQGTHEELKSSGGVYQQIYEIQTGVSGEVV